MLRKKKIAAMLILFICVINLVLPSAAYAENSGLVLEKVILPQNAISKGDIVTVSFDVRNNSLFTIKDLYMSVPTTDFSIIGSASTIFITNFLTPNSSVTINLKLECRDTKNSRIPLIFTGENYKNESFTFEEQLLVIFKEIPKEAAVPSFLITENDIEVIGLGETKELKIKVKNISEAAAAKVVITPQLQTDNRGMVNFNEINMRPSDIQLDPGNEQCFEFNVTCNGTALPDIYPITYHLQCENKNREVITADLTGYIKITDNKDMCDLLISEVSLSPGNLTRDQKMTIGVKLSNEYINEFTDLKVWIESLSAENFIFLENVKKKAPADMEADNPSVSFEYKIAKKAPEGNYPYEVHASYTDFKGNDIQCKESFILYLPEPEIKKGTLNIENIKLPEEETDAQKVFPVSFDVCNNTAADVEDIEAAYIGNTSVLPASNSVIKIKRLEAGTKQKVKFSLIAGKQTGSTLQPLMFQLQYDAIAGEGVEIKTLSQTMGVRVRESEEDKSQPRVIINKVKLPDKIVNGEPFDLEFTLKNTSGEKEIKNIKMTVSSVNAVTQISNILVKGQSDSIFIASLGCGVQETSAIRLLIPDSFKETICDIKFNIAYEDFKGNGYTDQETVHLPVEEMTQLTASDVRIGNVSESSYTLEMDFYNTGKGILKNLMVDLNGEFEATNSNYYVGDLKSGSMDIYSVSINGKIPENIKGSIAFSYEDNSGINDKVTIPFDLHYTAPAAQAFAAVQNDTQKTFPYGIVIAAFVLSAIIIIVVLRRKRKGRLS